MTSGQARSSRSARRTREPGRERVAVVGSGVAGLTAAYLLQRRYDVSLYEADDRLGGHAHTHDVLTADRGVTAIDTGFIVHNARTYPHLLRLFGELGVSTQPTEMSMSVRCEGCGLEYAGAKGIRGLFAQPRSATRPAYLRMLVEVKRFHRDAHRVLASGTDDVTLGQFLADGGYSPYFVQHFMVPLVSCVWSTSQQAALGYPARYLFAFLDNHGMLTVTGSPQWRTVVGGSRTLRREGGQGAHLGTPLHPGTRHPPGLGRGVDPRCRRRARAVLAGGRRHPRRHRAAAARRAERCRAGGARCVPLLPQPHRAAHRPTPAPPRRAGAGVVELRHAVVRDVERRRHGQL